MRRWVDVRLIKSIVFYLLESSTLTKGLLSRPPGKKISYIVNFNLRRYLQSIKNKRLHFKQKYIILTG